MVDTVFPVFEAFRLGKVKKHLFIKWGGDIHVMGAVLDQIYSTHHLQLLQGYDITWLKVALKVASNFPLVISQNV